MSLQKIIAASAFAYTAKGIRTLGNHYGAMCETYSCDTDDDCPSHCQAQGYVCKDSDDLYGDRKWCLMLWVGDWGDEECRRDVDCEGANTCSVEINGDWYCTTYK